MTNIIVLVIAALICFEKSKPLLDNFAADEPGLFIADAYKFEGRVVSISLEGAIVEVPDESGATAGAVGRFKVAGVGPFPAKITGIVRHRRSNVVSVKLGYELEGEVRDAMIVKLYTGDFSQDVAKLDKSAIAGGIIKRAFGSS
jgi:cellulose synthase (UDP-forming)